MTPTKEEIKVVHSLLDDTMSQREAVALLGIHRQTLASVIIKVIQYETRATK